MNQTYGRLNQTPSTRMTDPNPPTRTRACRLILFLTGALLIIAAACGIIAAAKSVRKPGNDPLSGHGTTRVIREACGLTRYPELCLSSLKSFPGAMEARDPLKVAHISVNMTVRKFGAALSASTEIRNMKMDKLTRSAYDDCLELLDDSVELLVRSLSSISEMTLSVEEAGTTNNGGNMFQGGFKSKQDVVTWLSGAMTNQDTCTDGLNNVGGTIKYKMVQRLQDLSELVSNCLAIYSASHKIDDLAGTPIQNRRLLGFEYEIDPDKSGFPKWMSRSERELLGSPTQSIQADIIVAQDGSGTVKTLTEAIKKAPSNSGRRIIILVKAGT